MSFKEFAKTLSKNEGVESELLKTIVLSLVTSFVVLGILYYVSFRNIDNFFSDYGFYIFFAILSYALILPSVIYVRAYREFTCMSGMMIGMTIGMISGFLSGFFVGATNGMFWGSVFGMGVGILFGIWNGKCCGIMGIMEGTMAGFMGGLMGAMTALMMFNYNLRPAGIILFLIGGVILFGLNYMLFKETREMERKHKDDEFFTISWSFILTTLTVFLMAYGPKGGLVI